MGSIGNGVINTFVDGDIVSASGTAPALLRSALNPKMQIIQQAIDDNDSRINVLEGQISGLGTTSVQYSVKASPFNAVGNGIADDTAAIQLAITTACTTQGVVIFPTGTYKITSPLVISGNCVLVTDGTSNSVIISQYTLGQYTFSITGSNVSINDLIIKTQTGTSGSYVIETPTATAASPLSNITIENCQIYDNSGLGINAIRFQHCSKVTIAGCSFTTDVYDGIKMLSCTNSTIYKNTFSTYDESIYLGRNSGSLATYPQTKSISIIENTFNAAFTTSTTRSILCYGTLNVFISKNIITMSSTTSSTGGILAQSDVDGNFPAYLQITDNYIDNSSVTGVVNFYIPIKITQASSGVIIAGNTIIEGNDSITLLQCSDALVVNNTITSSYNSGIAVITGSQTGNVIISNNAIVDVYHATASYVIQLDLSAPSGSTFPTTVANNSVRRGSKTGAYVVNNVGLYVKPFFIGGATSNGIFVNCSGNAFGACATPVSQSGTLFWIFYETSTGDRVFFSPTGAAPTTGTWRQGDQVIIASPTAGGYIGYVCTTAGTPGTWKGYGAIQP